MRASVLVLLAGCGRLSFDAVATSDAATVDGDLDGDLDADVDGATMPEVGLVAHWPLDETSGLVASERVAGNDGVVAGGPIWAPGLGQLGGALQFVADGDGDRVLANDPTPGPGSFSVSAWVNLDRLSDEAPGNRINFVAAGTDTIGLFKYRLGQTADCGAQNFVFRIQISATMRDLGAERCSSTVAQPDRWFHVVGVYDTAGPNLDIYVDGASANGAMCATCGTTVIPAALSIEPHSFAVGSDVNFAGTPAGYIDDVKIYSRALGAGDIATLFATGSTIE